jgi:hypothetical protein
VATESFLLQRQLSEVESYKMAAMAAAAVVNMLLLIGSSLFARIVLLRYCAAIHVYV